MGINKLYTLLKKYRERECTPQELEELDGWYGQFDGDKGSVAPIPEEKLDALFCRIESEIDRRGRKAPGVRRMVRYAVGVAAMGILLVGIGYFFPALENIPAQEPLARVNEIRPGRPQAELVLSDGSRVVLDSVVTVREKSGIVIKKDSSPLLDYSLMAGNKAIAGAYNTISVPRGGEYRVILADGTEVWLNSGSTMRYPVAFNQTEREVVLSGEGFFNVTKSVVPFVVRTFDLDIKVLGTSFNVSAYGDEDRVTAALVEGHVQVCNNHNEQKYSMKPGHVLSYEKLTAVTTLEAGDVELYTSWMNGELKFRDMRLEDIMNRVNRWYNCSVKYEDAGLKDLRFSGAAERDRPVSYLLDLIQTVTDVGYDIDGTTIVLKGK